MPVAVKICGLTDAQSVQAVITAGAAYAGFVHFPRSPRHLEPEAAAALRSLLPASIGAVSVVVDAEDALLRQLAATVKPGYFQLHGHESPERAAAIRAMLPHIKIIKAIPVRTADDIAKSMRYTQAVDMLLFDAKPSESAGMLPGGNGLSFDWALLKDRDFSLPWLLSGGLHAENVVDAIRQTGAAMVDVSSGVERAPGVKDPALIHAFVKASRHA